MHSRKLVFSVLMMMMAAAGAAHAQKTAEELAKAVQNPVASLISVPFQNNTNFNIGPYDRTQNVLNIQPVWPFSVGEWNLITRTIAPVISQPDVGSTSGSTSGLGDITFSAFLSPAEAGKVIWGVGPIFVLPTATDDVLGAKKWGVGPTAVVLLQPKPWVLGVLANNVWSVAGDDDREDVNALLLQYFINYNLQGGWYVLSAPIITANWKAESGQKWVVPFGGGVGKIFRAGKMPLNGQVSAYANVTKPAGGPEWQLRAQLQLLFPK